MTSSGFVHLPRDGRPCFCSACTCGRHACPGVFKVSPLNGSSHYRDTYTPKKGDRGATTNGKAPPLAIKAGPNHFLTTQQLASGPLANAQWERVTAYKPKATISAPAPFDGRTTQRTDFPGHAPSLPPRPPAQHALPKVPGTYDTTLSEMQRPVVDALRNGTAHRAQSASRHAQPIPRTPFDANSTYHVEFPLKQGEPVRPFSQRTGSAGIRENRDFQTTKSASYISPPVNVRPPCPVTLLPLRPASRDGHIKVEDA